MILINDKIYFISIRLFRKNLPEVVIETYKVKAMNKNFIVVNNYFLTSVPLISEYDYLCPQLNIPKVWQTDYRSEYIDDNLYGHVYSNYKNKITVFNKVKEAMRKEIKTKIFPIKLLKQLEGLKCK